MQIVVVGAGGHGKVTLEALRAAGEHEPVGFLDADSALHGSTPGGLRVLGALNCIPRLMRQGVRGAIIAIGDARTRQRCAALAREQGLELVNAIHPAAWIAPSARLGHGVVVAAGAAVGVETQVDDLAIINTGAIVDHECHVGAAAHVCPGVRIAGRVSIGEGAFVGLGACIIQCLKIGDWATIGAGAVVLEDVPTLVTAVGAPARLIHGSAPRMTLHRVAVASGEKVNADII